MKKEGRSLFLKGFVVFLFLLLVSSISLASEMQSAVINVQPASSEVSHGDIFSIEIKIEPKGSDIYGAQYILYFNPDLLNATSQTQGSFLSQDGSTTSVILNKANNSLGEIKYGETRMGAEHGVTEPGVLASITFEVTGTSGTSDLKLSDVMLCDINGTEIEATTNNGTCTITGTGPETTTTPMPTPTPSPPPTPTTEPTLTPEKTPSIIPSPSPSLSPTPAVSPSPVISPSPAASPSPSVPSPTPTPAGFEAVFAIAGLLVISSLLKLKRKRR